MTRSLSELLAARESASSPYSYTFHYDNDGDGRVLAHHASDGIVGGLSWDSGQGKVWGIYVDPKHQGTTAALGMLRLAQTEAEKRKISPPTGSDFVSQHGYQLQKKLAPHLEEPEVTKTDRRGTGFVENDLSKYADLNYSISSQQPIDDNR